MSTQPLSDDELVCLLIANSIYRPRWQSWEKPQPPLTNMWRTETEEFLQEQHPLCSRRLFTTLNKRRTSCVEFILSFEIRPTLWQLYWGLSYLNRIFKVWASLSSVRINKSKNNSVLHLVDITAEKSWLNYFIIRTGVLVVWAYCPRWIKNVLKAIKINTQWGSKNIYQWKYFFSSYLSY